MDHRVSNISLSVTSARGPSVLWFMVFRGNSFDRSFRAIPRPISSSKTKRRVGLPLLVEILLVVIETYLQFKGPSPGEHLVGLRPLSCSECRYDRLGFLQWRHFHLVTVLHRLARQVTDSAALVDGSQYATVHRRLVEAANRKWCDEWTRCSTPADLFGANYFGILKRLRVNYRSFLIWMTIKDS